MGWNIQKVAGETQDGAYFVKTNGLAARGHAELEIVGVPRPAVEPAAKLIDYVIEAVHENKGARLRPGENVGLPLVVGDHDEIPAVFVGVHALESEPAVSGFFAKVRGTATRGVLRLVDLPGSNHGPPLGALASMMLYRANCRFVTGDAAGAIAELRASIEMTPGDGSAGPPPQFDTGGADPNWQNHASYLRLAELVEPAEEAALHASVFSRFDWLARRHIGCRATDWSALAGSHLVDEASNILERNLRNPGVAPGPHAGLRLVASPVWTVRDDGTAIRAASLVPAGFVDYCFGERLADPNVADGLARLAADCVLRHAQEPWKVSFLTRGARELYAGTESAPTAEVLGPSRPAWLLLSSVLAEAARFLHAGATFDELRAAFGVAGAPEVPPSLAAKVAAHESWETGQYAAALGGPS
jgi:hypothetical protein